MKLADIKPDPGDENSSGSAEAPIARLYREHNEALIRFLVTRTGSEQEARDVAQEAYVRVLQLDKRGATSFLSAYLFKTAANIAIDYVRRRSMKRRADELLFPSAEGPPQDVTPENLLQAREQIQLIEVFLDELPLKCRQAFYLHRLHDMSPPDIAERLGIKKRMVHKYLVRAMTHLRARLEGEGGAKESDDER